MPKLISIVTPTYNEQENVFVLYKAVADIMSTLPQYDYEHIFIDNASTDKTILILRKLAKENKRVKVILNARNFGHIRSPMHGLLESRGDASIMLACDFQDPPYLIREFIKKWEEGYKVVMAVKTRSKEKWVVYKWRTLFYKVLNKLSETKLVEHYMGTGLYDKKVVDIMRKMDDPYPYLRGMVVDIGFESAKVEYERPVRKNGKSKNSLYVLFDIAMLGVVNYSKIPLRMATIIGFIVASCSFVVGIVYFVMKLSNWDNFQVGLAPIVIGVAFLGGIQLLFLGIIGEYIGAIHTQVLHRPLVIEKERINFD